MIRDWSPLVRGLEVFGRGLGLFDGHHNMSLGQLSLMPRL